LQKGGFGERDFIETKFIDRVFGETESGDQSENESLQKQSLGEFNVESESESAKNGAGHQ